VITGTGVYGNPGLPTHATLDIQGGILSRIFPDKRWTCMALCVMSSLPPKSCIVEIEICSWCVGQRCVSMFPLETFSHGVHSLYFLSRMFS
jgi:hypothetical protein